MRTKNQIALVHCYPNFTVIRLGFHLIGGDKVRNPYTNDLAWLLQFDSQQALIRLEATNLSLRQKFIDV